MPSVQCKSSELQRVNTLVDLIHPRKSTEDDETSSDKLIEKVDVLPNASVPKAQKVRIRTKIKCVSNI